MTGDEESFKYYEYLIKYLEHSKKCEFSMNDVIGMHIFKNKGQIRDTIRCSKILKYNANGNGRDIIFTKQHLIDWLDYQYNKAKVFIVGARINRETYSIFNEIKQKLTNKNDDKKISNADVIEYIFKEYKNKLEN